MWLFTRHGFFSVVANHRGDAVVRARRREHLESLLDRMDLHRRIVTLEHADYRYRVMIPKMSWIEISSQLAEDIDYSNFKAEAQKTIGIDDYTKMLHEVWALVDDRLGDRRRSAFCEEGMMGKSQAVKHPPPPRRGKNHVKGGRQRKKRNAHG